MDAALQHIFELFPSGCRVETARAVVTGSLVELLPPPLTHFGDFFQILHLCCGYCCRYYSLHNISSKTRLMNHLKTVGYYQRG